MLKKITTIITLSLILSILMPQAMPGRGYFASASVSDVILQPNDLGIEEPSILPTNPFYFLKKWQQDVRLLFTFNKLKKVQGVLDYTLEKSLELQKITLSAPQNASAIIKASNNLMEGLDSLRSYVYDFQLSEGFTSSSAQKFLNAELSKGIKLKKFFDQINKDKISSSAKKNMQKTEDKLTQTMVFIPLNLIISGNSQDLVMNKTQNILNFLDDSEKLELIIILDDFSKIYPDNHDVALLIKNESIKNLEDNLNKMSSGEFNKFVELNQDVVALNAQGANIASSLSKLSAKSSLSKFIIVLENNLVKDATLKFDSSTSTDFILSTLENLMIDDFYMETDVFYRSLQTASSTPEFIVSLQNLFIKNQRNFLGSLSGLQENLITKSINLDAWSKNKINIITLDSEKYFIQANDLYNKNKVADAIIVLDKAQNKINEAVSLGASLKIQSGDNSLCGSDILSVEDFCLEIGGNLTINKECPALNKCSLAQPKEEVHQVELEGEFISPAKEDSVSDNKSALSEQIKQDSKTEANDCSEKEVVCPALSKKCTDSLTLQYGGGCVATFEECNINEPTCPENLEN